MRAFAAALAGAFALSVAVIAYAPFTHTGSRWRPVADVLTWSWVAFGLGGMTVVALAAWLL